MSDSSYVESKPLPETPRTPIVQVCPLQAEEDTRKSGASSRSWLPVALRTFLIPVIVTTLGLVALLQVLLVQSQRNSGLLFARDITKISREQSFLYLYLPTIISVVFSLLWAWIDLDVKRLEPYRQLSRPNGASAKNSLLLQYQFDFLGSVLLTSLRRKHWTVFMSSMALVLVSWGITPLQAAMFATDTITKSYAEPMAVSTQFLTADEQRTTVSLNYTYSVFAIAWLNERLPAYMSRQAVLAPFQPHATTEKRDRETWTASTTLYSVNVSCESADLKSEEVTPLLGSSSRQLYYTSSHGCRIPYPYGPTGNTVMGGNDEQEIKEYSALYAGYDDHDGLADFYLSQYCPANASSVFLAVFAQNKRHARDTPKTATTLFCTPVYYQQNVTATVSREDGSIVDVIASGSVEDIPATMFDARQLEWQMNSATQQQAVRGDVPASTWPDQTERLSKLPISLQFNGADLPMMVGMAIGTDPRPMMDYLEPEVLRKAYEAAYRLLFTRYMVDILQPDFNKPALVNGICAYQTQAVYMIAGFTYAVECLLVTVAVLAGALLVIMARKNTNLRSDPGSIAALMKLVAPDQCLIDFFSPLDRSDMDRLEEKVTGEQYRLQPTEGGCKLIQIPSPAESDIINPASETGSTSESKHGKAGTPWGLSVWFGATFLVCLSILLAVLAYLYDAARPHGLRLPSQNHFVRQMLEKYLPTAIATLIEPAWVTLNRLLCMLQPFEELRKGNTPAARSISLDYMSLPPQLVALKAAANQHITLSAVCTMAVLSNVLAVAFRAMFNEETILTERSIDLTWPYFAKFKDIDASLGPWNTSANVGEGLDQFYIAMSNLTSSTPLPAWTDDHNFYLPFSLPAVDHDADLFSATTLGFGANVTCVSLHQSTTNAWRLAIGPDAWSNGAIANLSVTIDDSVLGSANCSAESMTISSQFQSGECPAGQLAMEVVTAMKATASDTLMDKQLCPQLIVSAWVRSPDPGRCFFDNESNNRQYINLTDQDATVIACLPRVSSISADTTVDHQGVLRTAVLNDDSTMNVAPYFTGDPADLIQQANNFIISRKTNSGIGGAGVWHNDSVPSDWNNYIMGHVSGLRDHDHGPNASTPGWFLDPSSSVPRADAVIPLFQKMYEKLFSIWLGLNRNEFLLAPRQSLPLTAGNTLQNEVRITMSRPMFLIAEVILGFYLVTAAAYFWHRPGRYLHRLPTTPASIIAMFAASYAISDFKERPGKDGEHSLQRYGYGTFLGKDRKLHMGIEKEPYVTITSSLTTSWGHIYQSARNRLGRQKRRHESGSMPQGLPESRMEGCR